MKNCSRRSVPFRAACSFFALSTLCSVGVATGAEETIKSAVINDLFLGQASVKPTGTYSTAKSVSGKIGIASPSGATNAAGGDLIVSVIGLNGENPRPTSVLLLDASRVTAANGGTWPATPSHLKTVLTQHPKCILAQIQTEPPQMVRVSGVPEGKKVTVVTGAEALFGNPPRTPPGSQAMVTNAAQLPLTARKILSSSSLVAATK